MNTNLPTNRIHPAGVPYALRRESGLWHLTFEGRQATFKHELGALYVAYLLLNPPKEPLHAVALALKAREMAEKPAGPDEVLAEQSMGLEDAAAVRALWRRQRELERVLADRLEIEPTKAEALRELEEITEHLRKSPWLSRHGAERCVRAVAVAIKRLHARLGVGLFVFGLASLVWPPLKVIMGSVTTSAAVMLGGLALMVLPSLVAGNELLILGGVAVTVGGWFLAHRHGELRGTVAASTLKPPAATGDGRP
jgi:hypothetical protein